MGLTGSVEENERSSDETEIVGGWGGDGNRETGGYGGVFEGGYPQQDEE